MWEVKKLYLFIEDKTERFGFSDSLNFEEVIKSVIRQYELPNVFINYGDNDFSTAERIYKDLEREGIKPLWRKNLSGGQKSEDISKLIKKSNYFLMLISKSAEQEKGLVHKEKKIAVKESEELNRVFIIPVSIDGTKGTDVEDLIHVDLSPYEEGLQQILRTIKNEKEN